MKYKKQIILVFAAFLLGSLIGFSSVYFKSQTSDSHKAHDSSVEEKQLYTCGMHPDVISEEPGNCPICGMKLTPVKKAGSSKSSESKGKGKILYWRAPMDPAYISDKPGKSPMGMDLIPVYDGEESSASGSILIDPITVQNMGIKTAPVQRKDLSRTLRAVGIIAYNEERLYKVNAKVSGWIEKLHVNYTGQTIHKGQPLLEIYSPDLVSAQEEYLLALKNKELVKESAFDEIKKGSQTLLASTKKRLENWDISNRAIENIEKRRMVSKTMTLTSPVNGVVIHKNTTEGMFVKEGLDLYHIADLSSVWVNVSVYEYETPWVKVGQSAEMELSYLPGKKLKGKVTYIYPYLNQKTRNLKVRLEFSNPNLELKPGMYANVVIHTNVVKNVLVIPGESVIRTGVRNIVFVTHEEGKFEPREIKIGIEGENGNVQVIAGLLGNERVVTSGQFLLDSESNAQEAIKKMLEAKKQMKGRQ
jgi:Cu(I)/Ag(I) efflux system membrane fusion protein/cobalt-zinc-cadmium efflux system membrane fusion protein